MKLSSPGKGIHPMNSSTLLSIWKRCFRLSFLSNQWRNPFFYKLKLKRETKQLFFPSRWTGQGKHALSTSPIAVFCRYSLFKKDIDSALGLVKKLSLGMTSFLRTLPGMFPDRPTLAFCHAALDQVCLPPELRSHSRFAHPFFEPCQW